MKERNHRWILGILLGSLAIFHLLLVMNLISVDFKYVMSIMVLAIFILKWVSYRRRKASTEDEKRLHLIEASLNISHEMIFIVDDNHLIQAFNSSTVKIFFPKKVSAGQAIFALFPSLVPEEMRRIRSLLLQEPEVRKEITIYKDGIELVYELVFNEIPYEKKDYLIIFGRNYTLQFKQAQELTQTKRQLEQFLDGIPGGAFIKEKSGRILYQNQQAIFESMEFPQLHQFTTQPVVNRIKSSRIPAELRAYSKKYPEEFREWEVWQFPLVTTGEDLYAGIILDVSPRRVQERLLSESQAFLEATINQSPLGLIILDGNTASIKLINQGLKRLLGIPEYENLTGRSINFEKLEWQLFSLDGKPFPTDENPIFKAFFQGATTSDRMIIRKKNGAERYVLVNSGPVHDFKNNFIAVMVAFLDITELHLAETQLQTLNRDLENRVESRTLELRNTNVNLQIAIDELKETQNQLIETEKMAGLGSLVAGVAHEINTPIGVSVTAASLMEELTNLLGTRFHENKMTRSELELYIKKASQTSRVILSNLERASQLIQSFKLISVDQSTDQLRNFHPVLYFQDVFKSLHPPDKKIRLDIQVEGDRSAVISSYPGAFSQILTNLYMNSCIHAFEDRNEGTIFANLEFSAKGMQFEFRDNGKGMSSEIQRQIFTPFFSTKRNRGGTGLGMHIVYNLVSQKLSGQIKVFSTEGEGTSFILDFPNIKPVSFDVANPEERRNQEM